MTSNGEHQRARLLLEERIMGSVSEADGRWLSGHLASCSECSNVETEMRNTISLLRSEPIVAPTFLVGRTKANVRIRARELQENAARTRMLLFSLVFALVWSALSIYAAYAVFDSWVPESTFGLSRNTIAWSVGFLWFWFAPALFLLVALIRSNGESLRAAAGITERGFENE